MRLKAPLLLAIVLALPAAMLVAPRSADRPPPPPPTPAVPEPQRPQKPLPRPPAPPSLAAAIGWQESGFNNAMVSSANARGVMQVMPGTWTWVEQNLAGSQQLDPNSATDNVHAGVLYLKRLIDDAGGDESAAVAGYYQGLASVRDRGMYDDTKQYVANVQALRSRFGG